MITDSNAYLPADATLSADKVSAGNDFDFIKAALDPLGGADTFYLYNLVLTPPLNGEETVNLAVKADGSEYPADDKTVLYYASVEDGTATLTEVTRNAGGTMRADVSKMGYYVVARVKETPAIPSLNGVTYSETQTLANIVLPTGEGGTWA